MPSPDFRFKDFLIKQNLSSMKVGTDGVLLGAWADLTSIGLSEFNQKQKEITTNLLDIGTGTGLIAMMLAQRFFSKEEKSKNLLIEAIDIDEPSCLQAKQNIEASNYIGNINVYHTGLQSFLIKAKREHYDLIISNPPFFSRSLKSGKFSRNIARHSDIAELNSGKLIWAVLKLLKPEGIFCLILPKKEGELFISEASRNKLFCTRLTHVFPKPGKEPIRYLMEFQFKQKERLEGSITIETGKNPNDFTEEYRELTKDFYLAF